MTCFPKAFPIFSPFSFSSRCLYLAYVLFWTSSLTLSTLSCVHLCSNLSLPMILFNSSRFLCCSVPSPGVSKTSPKKSSSFHMSPTPATAFITYQNYQHMINNIRYKDVSCCSSFHF